MKLVAISNVLKQKRSRVAIVRYFSKRFSDSVLLPKTDFPLSFRGQHAAQRERRIRKEKHFDTLYAWQLDSSDRRRTFVLHDGPPYANGETHMGHALNKITKDITNRYHVLKGCSVFYQPGWDCHGLPIEQKALENVKANHLDMEPLDIRAIARKLATKTVKSQINSFQNWGIMTDWHNVYQTMTPDYISDELDVFINLYEKGLIYHDFMPVLWSPSSRTALAEAEIEYRDDHVSTAAFVAFPLCLVPPEIETLACGGRVSLLIWTTTPWTLASNQAIAFNSHYRYSVVKCGHQNLYIVASDMLETLRPSLPEFRCISEFEGSGLEGCLYRHPLYPEQPSPVLNSPHVTMDMGTGLVHIAPAHGLVDFRLSVKNNIKPRLLVDDRGCYTEDALPELRGRSVLKDGDHTVLDMLGGHVVSAAAHTHRYPYDWRSKQPVITRASRQWFVDIASIKDQAIAELEKVEMYPEYLQQALVQQIQSRPYWCISRQRAWGVPIPAVYNKITGKPLVNRELVDHVKKLVTQRGPDFWWEVSVEEILPDKYKNSHDEYVKGRDVLDIWFDSGTSWAHVLKDQGCVADVYLEGVDQITGWFQTSLMTSVAATGKAPYKKVVAHNFVLDGDGKKMSKSLGNVIHPDDIVNGYQNKKESSFGADVLRWWVASEGSGMICVSQDRLEHCKQTVRKALRFMMGNLSNFDASQDAAGLSDIRLLDKFCLYRLSKLITEVNSLYSSFQYSAVVRAIVMFIEDDLSKIYFSSIKDRLYCSPEASFGRRAAQTVLFHCLSHVTRAVAPILPHLAEEIYDYHPFNGGSVFRELWAEPPAEWNQADIAQWMDVILDIRHRVNQALAGQTTPPGAWDLHLRASPLLLSRLQELQPTTDFTHTSELCEIMQVATVTLAPLETSTTDCHEVSMPCSERPEQYDVTVSRARGEVCPRCRRAASDVAGQLCERCLVVLSENWDS